MRETVQPMKQIRQKRLQYELELIQSKKSDNWGEAYLGKLSPLLHVTRNTLDNCISVCQVSHQYKLSEIF